MQRIHTNDGYAIPLNIRNGLPYCALSLIQNGKSCHMLCSIVIQFGILGFYSIITGEDTWYDAASAYVNDDISYNVFDQLATSSEFCSYRTTN